MINLPRLSIILQLDPQSPSQQFPFHPSSSDLRHDCLMDSIQDSWNGREDVWFDDLSIFEESKWVTCSVTDFTVDVDEEDFKESFEAVMQR